MKAHTLYDPNGTWTKLVNLNFGREKHYEMQNIFGKCWFYKHFKANPGKLSQTKLECNHYEMYAKTEKLLPLHLKLGIGVYWYDWTVINQRSYSSHGL